MKQVTQLIRNSGIKEQLIASLFITLSAMILIKAFDEPLMILKGFLFCIFLILISYCDSKTREIPNVLLLPILAIGFIHVSWLSVAGLFLPAILLFILSCLTDSPGGGDIKFMAASGFVLGVYGSLAGALLGFGFAFLANIVTALKQKSSLSIPVAPYLSIGFFTAFILFN